MFHIESDANPIDANQIQRSYKSGAAKSILCGMIEDDITPFYKY
jgi:hypothetical protein